MGEAGEPVTEAGNPYEELDDDELLGQCRIEVYRGSGPGGQHRNKVETAVRLTHEPTEIRVTASERRSRQANMRAAIERLRERLEKRFARPKPRRKTRKSRGVRTRELAEKRRRGETKRLRQRPRGED